MTDNNDNPPPPDRESVWSIPARWQAAYFIIFAVLNTAGISLVCWYEIAIHTEDDAVRTILNIIERAASVAIGAAAFTITVMEGANNIMVSARYLEQWLNDRRTAKNQQLRTEERAKGRAEANKAWAEWLDRKMDAEARGETFTEPPPDFTSSEQNGTQPE